MSETVRITSAILNHMLAVTREQLKEECCGLLAGRQGTITHIFPTANVLASPTRYEIAPLELFRIFRAMRESSLDHLGIYHSHPNTDNSPSPRDIELSFYPEAVYFILSPRQDAPHPVRAFRIFDRTFSELTIEIV